VPTLSSLFADKYYSTLLWKPVFDGGDVWPLTDSSVRFPELLTSHGVHTINVATKSWLMSSRKVVAGFEEEYDLDQNAADRQKHVESGPILARMRESLGHPRTGPTFVYSHFMDPHSPYDSGKLKRGAGKKALYVSEIERLDEELAEFDQWLDAQGLGGRVVWIVSADHGESFGEHGVTFHAKNIYEELVHVPLWIRIPGLGASRIETAVSTMDLAPTLLDLFGVATPAEYMGQSLVPYLRGESNVKLWRPIAAETHLKQSLLFPDGFKAIRDQRTGTREVYDLRKDPKELKNLIDSADPRYQDQLDLFFAVHRNPSYAKQAPYRH
jgi:membrane-anchored protein YejM (alkaline phosphatase superfamily)